MVRPNDTVPPGGADGTERPGPARHDRRSSIILNVDEGEEDREVTLDEFKQFVTEGPQWLYEKLPEMHGRFHSTADDREGEVAEVHLRMKAMEGEIALLQKDRDEVRMERDAFSRQIAWTAMETCSRQQPAESVARKSTKIPDPPMLTDGKEPRFEDWLLLMNQKLEANADPFNTSQLRRAYVASRCEGKARKHITPQTANRLDVINHRTQRN